MKKFRAVPVLRKMLNSYNRIPEEVMLQATGMYFGGKNKSYKLVADEKPGMIP